MSLHAYAPRDSPPSYTLLDQNLDPRVDELISNTSLKILDLSETAACGKKKLHFDQTD